MAAYNQGRGIAATGMMMAMMVVLAFSSKAVMATNYVVGDTDQWTLVKYDSWVTGKTFKVNDTLQFIYSKAHDVVEVNKADYDACSKGSNTVYTDGNTTFVLNEAGSKYYICSIPGHCGDGMKLAVDVVAASATPPTSSPTPTTPSTPATPNTTTTPSSTNSASLSLPLSFFNLVLVLGLSILYFQSL